ncbi:hypothetical protein [Ensifer sp. B1-9]|uniref:hypothetical protein n=1 Tax=Ensifer sp. B1-9 TaxID=3141455 RepID=UPI003D2514BC
MRTFIAAFAIAALAVTPCAWDSDPREPGALAAIFANSMSEVVSGDASPSQDAAYSDEVLQEEVEAGL